LHLWLGVAGLFGPGRASPLRGRRQDVNATEGAIRVATVQRDL
jgi:hypothetical protein